MSGWQLGLALFGCWLLGVACCACAIYLYARRVFTRKMGQLAAVLVTGTSPPRPVEELGEELPWLKDEPNPLNPPPNEPLP